MEINAAIKAIRALAQKSRLEAFRLLVRAGPNGLPAGRIAQGLSVPQSTMSAHLSVLANAGLVISRREGRSIIYSIDFAGVRALLSFLMEDCCQGQPDICAPLLACVLPDCPGADAQGPSVDHSAC